MEISLSFIFGFLWMPHVCSNKTVPPFSAGRCAAYPAAQWRRSSPTCTLTAAHCGTSVLNAPNSSPMSFPPVAGAWTSSTILPRGRPKLLLLLLLLLRDHSCNASPKSRRSLKQTLTLHFSLSHSVSLPTPNIKSSSTTPRRSTMQANEQTDGHCAHIHRQTRLLVGSCTAVTTQRAIWLAPINRNENTRSSEVLQGSLNITGLNGCAMIYKA